jgi:hypothetical protein
MRVFAHIVLGRRRPQFGGRQRADFALRAIVSEETSIG